jgi:hypothetical protein
LGPAAIRTFGEPRGPIPGNSSKLADLAYSGQFSILLLTDIGSRCDPNFLGTPGSDYGELVKTHRFGQFWLDFYTITHLFLVPLRSERSGNPGVRLRGARQNSQICPILTSFLYYYSLILGPAAIRTFGEPRGPITGNSSKLADLAYSVQFSILLLTDIGSRCDPNFLGTPGSDYGELIKTRRFVLLWPVFYTITHLFWVPMRSERSGNPWVRLRGAPQNSQICSIVVSFLYYYSLILGPAAIRTFGEPRGPITGNSSKLADLDYSVQFSILLLNDIGSRYDPNFLGTPGSEYGELVITHRFGLFSLVFYTITH